MRSCSKSFRRERSRSVQRHVRQSLCGLQSPQEWRFCFVRLRICRDEREWERNRIMSAVRATGGVEKRKATHALGAWGYSQEDIISLLNSLIRGARCAFREVEHVCLFIIVIINHSNRLEPFGPFRNVGSQDEGLATSSHDDCEIFPRFRQNAIANNDS